MHEILGAAFTCQYLPNPPLPSSVLPIHDPFSLLKSNCLQSNIPVFPSVNSSGFSSTLQPFAVGHLLLHILMRFIPMVLKLSVYH